MAWPFNRNEKETINPSPAINEISQIPKNPAQGVEVNTDDVELKFYIDLRPRIIELKTVHDKTMIDVRYPLMPPFAYAHIYWDDA